MNLLTKAYIFNFLTIDDKIQNFENFKLQNNFQTFKFLIEFLKFVNINIYKSNCDYTFLIIFISINLLLNFQVFLVHL